MTVARIALIALLMAATSVTAQSRRAGMNEVYFGMAGSESKDYTFEGGTTASTDSGFGLNFGWLHHINPNFAAGVELGWMDIDYQATVQPGLANPNVSGRINGSVETFSLRFTGAWHILPGDFTPYLGAGLGWTYIDTNIPAGLPESFCWYYPWYGSYCSTYVPTQTTTQFSYNVGVGLRYDFGRGVIRAAVEQQYVDFGGSYGSDHLTQYRIELGTKF
ncbi:MAG TPA: outer membrane beta-barrel protein [Burkholderiales bacterium]|nr:outer membrane beta-barrel protein [Burkholderiales bacterium]